ncbi:MAG: adenylate/guanylate cyclase domain-containing protein [Candidatus Cloacimonetes bacterium]|nr:adenylate/guanylate cyclase domain-containing protein [Candidatus Cloacimonadota bacterium]
MLQKKLLELQGSKCSPAVTEVIRNLIVNGSDFDCYKINVFRVAEENQLSKAETIQGFLYAARLGIMDLSWDIHCASCKGIPEYHKHLMGLQNKAHCNLCSVDWDLSFEEQVEVSFTVNPDIRQIKYPDWSERDFDGKMQFLDDILSREKRNFTVGTCIFEGKTTVVRGEFTPGEYYFYAPGFLEDAGKVFVSEEKTTELQTVALTYDKNLKTDTKTLHLKSGQVEFHVTAAIEGMCGFLILPQKPVHNFVSAAYISGLQDFKDLFAGEFLREDVSFAIKSITIMFTDIKGSTAMYEKLGDSQAYALVQKHFDIMTEVIQKHNGGIVKTIGDAVMASFSVNSDAVKAAVKLQKMFWELSQSEALRGVLVKIGLHRGPVIAVTSNRSLDYFGRTANIAARVQSKANEDEVLISDSVYSDPAVHDYIQAQGYHIESRQELFKGIEGQFLVYSIH